MEERNGFPPSLRAAVRALLLSSLAGCAPEGVQQVDRTVDREGAVAAYRAGLQHFRDEELDEAIAACRRAIELDPDLAEAHWVLGKVLYFRSDVVIGTPTRDEALLAEAAAELARAAELDPKKVEYVFWAGRALALLGRSEEAAASFRAVLERDAGYGAAYKELALIHSDQGDDARARENFELAVELLPDDADLWFHYGMQLEVEEDLERAQAAYERSRELDWTVPRTYSRLAVLLERLGNSERAEVATREFEKWSEFGSQLNERLTLAHADRTNVESLMAVGELYMSARRYAAAAAWFKRACTVDPRDQKAQLALKKAQAEAREQEKRS